MSISIHTPNHARNHYDRVEFCYLCGDLFTQERPKTRDHVPPKAIFKLEDRNFPLLLPAHQECNVRYSMADEQIAQLIAMLHGSETPPSRVNVLGPITAPRGEMGIAVNNLPLGPMITKIVRGCHSILYNSFMSTQTQNKILSPIPTLDEATMRPAEENSLPQHAHFCKKLKDSRNLGTVDSICAFNGKFEFYCCWARSDDGRHVFNMFGMRLYNWERLGDRVLGRPQGCLGFYVSPNGQVPRDASLAHTGSSAYRYQEDLNPFEQGTLSPT